MEGVQMGRGNFEGNGGNDLKLDCGDDHTTHKFLKIFVHLKQVILWYVHYTSI